MKHLRLLTLLLAAVTVAPVFAQDIDGIRVEHANRQNQARTVSAPDFPVRFGTTALAFQVQDGQCRGNRTYDDCRGGRERSEITDRGRVSTDQEVWYAFSMFIPSYTPSLDPAATSLAQWQDTRGSGEVTLGLGLWREGLELVQDDPRTAQTDDTAPPRPMIIRVVTPASRLRDRWLDLRVQAIWSVRDTGLIRVWINDRLVHEHQGRNLNRDVAPSFKFGIYRSGLARLRDQGQPVPTQTVFFDGIRRGPTQASVTVP